MMDPNAMDPHASTRTQIASQWSTRSIKQVIFGLVIVIASTGLEPIFAAFGIGNAGLACLAVLIFVGILVAAIGVANP